MASLLDVFDERIAGFMNIQLLQQQLWFWSLDSCGCESSLVVDCECGGRRSWLGAVDIKGELLTGREP